MGLFKKPGEHLDKSRPDFSNVTSGGSSTAPSPGAAPASVPSQERAERRYTVVEGDSLSKIALREYGDAGQWRRIFEANRDQINDPDLIHPGQSLRIP
jgi:nucleoid-associated protein YgaU